MDVEGKADDGRSVSSVRLDWEDLSKTGWRETQCQDSKVG